MTILLVVLFLYWIVQDPIGAADTIKNVAHWLGHLAQQVANHLIRFVNALQ